MVGVASRHQIRVASPQAELVPNPRPPAVVGQNQVLLLRVSHACLVRVLHVSKDVRDRVVNCLRPCGPLCLRRQIVRTSRLLRPTTSKQADCNRGKKQCV